MRHSNHARGPRLPSGAAGVAMLVMAAIVVACGGTAAPSVEPTPLPTPVVTPDPHLTAPVSADDIFRALGTAKLGITANNANSGRGNPAIVKQINADIGNWPLRITQYRSIADLQEALKWKPGEKPVRNETPYAFAGLNVLVEYGPVSSAGDPKTPDASRQTFAQQIVAVLDPLLWPLDQHSVVAIASRTPIPSAAPSAAPTPSKAPTKTKAPAKTPKPSRKP
jgi:hypothetical protein